MDVLSKLVHQVLVWVYVYLCTYLQLLLNPDCDLLMGRILSITANDIVRMFEQDREACRRLAELLAPDIARSVLQGAATKQDIEKLRQEIEKLRSDFNEFRQETKQETSEIRKEISGLKEEINEVKGEINGLRREISELKEEIGVLRERVARVEGVLSLLVKVFIAFNVPLLIAVIGILLKMALIP